MTDKPVMFLSRFAAKEHREQRGSTPCTPNYYLFTLTKLSFVRSLSGKMLHEAGSTGETFISLGEGSAFICGQ